MFFINAFVSVPLFSICAITLHHETAKGKLHKKIRSVEKSLLDDMEALALQQEEEKSLPENGNDLKGCDLQMQLSEQPLDAMISGATSIGDLSTDITMQSDDHLGL